ncbi:MAG: c-type cytochrome domain-containing protein [Isosphaerales bacterium]
MIDWPQRISVALLALGLGPCAALVRGDDSSAPTYERDIKPLFARRCTACHKDSKRHDPDISGGLALDSLEGILAGTPREKVVVPGRSGSSELVRRLAERDEDRRMPSQDKPLPERQQELVRRWVDAGAPRGAALASAGDSRPHRLRWVRSLEVLLPSDVKLAPGTLNAPKGGALAVTLRVGPLPPVTALAFNGDNRLLAVGTYGQVVLWDLYEGRPAGSLLEIPGPVHALAFSRDGRRLAVGAGLPARSGVAQVYTVPDGTKIHDFAGHDDVVSALAFRPDGAQLATASFDQTVRLWNLGLDRPDGVFRGHSDFVYAVAYTRDGRALLTGGKDRMIKRLSARTLKEEHTYSEHGDDVLTVAVHPDGKRFVSAGNEPQIHWWNFQADKSQSRRGGHSGPVQQLAFSGDGQRLISAGGDRTVRLWNGRTGEPIRQLAGAGEWQYAVAISDDGRLAAAGGWDGLARLWDTGSGRLRATLVQPPGAAGSPSPGVEPSSAPWFAITPGGYVAGSLDLIKLAEWRAGGVSLPAQAARTACDRPDIVARAMRGEPVSVVSFPSKK